MLFVWEAVRKDRFDPLEKGFHMILLVIDWVSL
jgi:hypothetical protein